MRLVILASCALLLAASGTVAIAGAPIYPVPPQALLSGPNTWSGLQTFSGALTGNVTGNVSGSSGSTTGNAATATALATGRTISITGDLAYTSPSFTGAGNVTAAGTLATVNSAIGACGDATHVAVVTLNAKGLTTGCIATTIAGVPASTATTLATPRLIGTLTGDVTSAGSNFDGSAANANATTLASTISGAKTFSTSLTTPVLTLPDPTVAGTIDALRLTNTGTQSAGTAVGISLDPRNAGVGVRDAQIVASTPTAGGSASLHFRIANGVAPTDTWVMGMAGDFYCASCAVPGNSGQIAATRFVGPVTGTLTGSFASARTFSYTGDVTGGPTSFDGSANVSTATLLATTQASAHTWSANQTFGALVLLHGYTVSTLPTCNSGAQGGSAYVTDATAPTYLVTLTGGGSVVAPVFCNGSAWVAA